MIGVRAQELAERGHIQFVMPRSEDRQVLFREPKQTSGRRQAPAVLRVRRMLEVFLQMHECACCLNQSLEKIVVSRVRV